MNRLAFLTSTLFVILTNVAMGQSNSTPEQRSQMQTEWMKENLQLNDSQMVEVETLNLKYAQKMEKVKDIDGKLGKLKAARKISDEKDEKLKQLLDEDQFQLYLDHRKEQRKNAKKMYKKRKNKGR